MVCKYLALLKTFTWPAEGLQLTCVYCAEDIVERMEALCHANKLWASAFSEAALDKSWWFGGTKTTSSMVHTLLGLRFHKLLLNPGVMADWVQQSGVILSQAAQFFPELDVSCCCFDCVKHGCMKQNLPDAKWLETTFMFHKTCTYKLHAMQRPACTM